MSTAVSGLGLEASGGAGAAGADEEFHLVASLSELKRSGRKRVAVGERVIVVFYVAGQLYALDHFCYRERKSLMALHVYIHKTHVNRSVPTQSRRGPRVM